MPETPQQLYIICDNDFFLESKTTFLCSVDTVKTALSSPEFLEDHEYRFEGGHLVSVDILPYARQRGALEVVAHYVDRSGVPEQTSFYLLPVKTFT